jgi:hypothetical protein
MVKAYALGVKSKPPAERGDVPIAAAADVRKVDESLAATRKA